MRHIKYVSLMLIAFTLIIGCSGNYGIYKTQTGSESKATKRELIDNWSDYDIWVNSGPEYKPDRINVIIFDKKNDDRKILVGIYYSNVKDQEMWTEIVKANATGDGEFNLVWDNTRIQRPTGVLEVWSSENQLFGFIIIREDAVTWQRVEQVDENTIRLSLRYTRRNPSDGIW